MHLQAQLMQENNKNNHKLSILEKHTGIKGRERTVHTNPVFQFIASCSVGSSVQYELMDSKIHTHLCQLTLFEANIALRTGLSKPHSEFYI